MINSDARNSAVFCVDLTVFFTVTVLSANSVISLTWLGVFSFMGRQQACGCRLCSGGFQPCVWGIATVFVFVTVLSCSLSPVLSAISVISLTWVRVYSFMGNHCTGDVSQLFLSNCFGCFVASDRVGVCHSLCRISCRRRSSAISVELVRTLLSGVFHAPCVFFLLFFNFVASDRVGVCHSLCRISCRRRSSAISVDLVRTLLSGVISRAVRLFLLF